MSRRAPPPPAQQSLRPPAPAEPLAARMRPRTLDEYVGQDHIIGPGRLLRRAIEADQLTSLIFYGPPGTGKTTLARVIAGSTKARFSALNAVLAGVKDIRDAVTDAQQLRDSHGKRTILFVDEVHRFNKAQQDALLPWVENGTVVLVGATTENPYFEVNKALVSRSRIFQLRPLTADDLRRVLDQAIADRERGYGDRHVVLAPDAVDHLVEVANGDARAVLNALELAVETTPPDADGRVQITLAVAEESIQRRAVLYDKEGDAHFDTISAFIKSVRGSDPDAALYWLARMVYAGEDPRFIFRRLIILASEDIGLADPQAVSIVMACARSFDRIGMPEGRYPLAQATLYLASTAKSNSTMAFFDALDAVARERADDVPNHLKDGNRDKEGFGHGEGYLYPHAYRDHWVAQQYLPDELKGRVFWQPSDQGWEGQVGPRVARQREAQLAAMLEADQSDPFARSRGEQLTTGPQDKRLERWLQRTASQAGERLAQLREAVIEAADLARHHVVLDLDAGAGLLTWEALRQVPEGGVWAWCPRADQAAALSGLAERLPELQRPRVVGGDLATLRERADAVRFDRIVGRDLLVRAEDPEAVVQASLALLAQDGRIALVEGLARRTQRLYALLGDRLGQQLLRVWSRAEEAVWADPADPLLAWTPQALQALLQDAGLTVATREVLTHHRLHVSAPVLERWLADRPGSWLSRLKAHVPATEADAIAHEVRRLEGRTVRWQGESVVLVAERS
ncbi:MAG: AAA family ATPase [Alphaproteobacteria bacterium]|nr:AAA family ATPase [Alphaproteobacteria bacterium]